MNIRIYPSTINGTIQAPPSKSVSHRAIICAALAQGISHISNILHSDDISQTIQACKAFGVSIEEKDNTLVIKGTNGQLIAPKKPIFLGNSGTSMRLIAGLASIAKGKTVLTGEKRLCQRPMKDLLVALNKLGIQAKSIGNNDCPPIEIIGGTPKGGIVELSAQVSSQYVSSLLLIGVFTKEPLQINVKNLRSKPYIAITIDVMKQFGVEVKNYESQFIVDNNQRYEAQQYSVEGDFSSASYLFAAAAVTKGKVLVTSLNPQSSQGDRYFLDILKEMTCDVSIDSNTITVRGPRQLKNITIDMKDYPDIVQTLLVVAANAKGTTTIQNIGHLRFKETDRIAAPVAELQKMGITATVSGNDIEVTGAKLKGETIETYNDHRMAMSFAIAALSANGPSIIEHTEVVEKSYPNYFRDLKSLGARMEELS